MLYILVQLLVGVLAHKSRRPGWVQREGERGKKCTEGRAPSSQRREEFDQRQPLRMVRGGWLPSTGAGGSCPQGGVA